MALTTSAATLLTGDLAAIFDIPAPAGFLVKTVAQGSMAWNMGRQGTTGSSPSVGKNTLAAVPPGRPFKVSVLRAGRILELTGTSQ